MPYYRNIGSDVHCADVFISKFLKSLSSTEPIRNATRRSGI